MASIPLRDRLTCTIKEASEGTGRSVPQLYIDIREGRLATTKVGKRRYVIVRSLVALLDPESLTAEQAA